MSDTAQSTQVLCTECKHSFRSWSDIISLTSKRYSMKCRKAYVEETTELDPVTGPKKVPARYEGCGMARVMSKLCGEQGRFWEPKDTKKHFFTMIKHEAEIK